MGPSILIKTYYNFNGLKQLCWTGALNTIKTIEEHNKQDELMYLLEDVFQDTIPTRTQINDFIFYDDNFIFKSLNIDIEE